ncbi:MAG TPA: response regulator [Alphaproteobacteria bacterium]|nr:response regulator [Alphaproteobacteria bacterium]HOO50873.1 response regulator [Alphaproteobacteria bacterium]
MVQSEYDQKNQTEPYVLIVEDSPVDFEIISRAFRKIEFQPKIHHCEDGDQALDFLSNKQNAYIAEAPTLVLLDLNLPGTDGRTVLSSMKSQEELKQIPVIVLSTSNNDNDVEFCFSMGADKYLRKPISADEYAETAKIIRDFWNTRTNNYNTYQ